MRLKLENSSHDAFSGSDTVQSSYAGNLLAITVGMEQALNETVDAMQEYMQHLPTLLLCSRSHSSYCLQAFESVYQQP